MVLQGKREYDAYKTPARNFPRVSGDLCCGTLDGFIMLGSWGKSKFENYRRRILATNDLFLQ